MAAHFPKVRSTATNVPSWRPPEDMGYVCGVHVRLLTAALTLALLARSAYDQPCSCGQKSTDPFTRTTVTTTVPHVRADHCACRCDGTGEELLMTPFQLDCRAFEVECTTSSGQSARYVCR